MRKSGIEMIRLLAMFFVVTLHVLGAGGILRSVEKGSQTYFVLWLIEIIAYIAVNLFGLISGYVMYQKKMTVKKFLNFYFRVFFYTIMIWLVMLAMGWYDADFGVAFLMSLPHKTKLWYIQCYFMLMILMPLFNLFLQKTEEKYLLRYLFILVATMLIYPAFENNDVWDFDGGYSIIWLCLLYFAGGVIAKCKIDEMVSRKRWMFYWLISVLFIWGSKIGMEQVANRGAQEYEEYNFLITYVSPPMVIAAFCLFCAFSTIRIKMPKWFYVVSGASFGVYIVHLHHALTGIIITNRFVVYAQWPAIKMLLRIACGIVGIFVCSLVISIVLGFLYDKIWLWMNRMLERRKANEKQM